LFHHCTCYDVQQKATQFQAEKKIGLARQINPWQSTLFSLRPWYAAAEMSYTLIMCSIFMIDKMREDEVNVPVMEIFKVKINNDGTLDR
jgi:hypothetical protein